MAVKPWHANVIIPYWGFCPLLPLQAHGGEFANFIVTPPLVRVCSSQAWRSLVSLLQGQNIYILLISEGPQKAHVCCGHSFIILLLFSWFIIQASLVVSLYLRVMCVAKFDLTSTLLKRWLSLSWWRNFAPNVIILLQSLLNTSISLK
jgi:hypothetical protein